RVVDLGDGRDGGDHGNGGLATAGDHVDVRRVQVFFQIDHRHTVGTDGGRGQVDDADTGLRVAQQLVVVDVGAGGGGIEDDIDVSEFRHLDQAVHAGGAGGHTHARCTGQAVGGRVDADHHAHFQRLAMAQDLDHQIGADVAGTNNCSLQTAG